MSLWGRIGRRVREVIERFTEPREPSRPESREPEPEPREPEWTGGHSGSERDEPEPESQLPDGWVIAGLYHEGQKTQRISATDDTEVTDNDIHGADAIIVHYVDAGEDGYRWIHGATGWDSLADQVERVIAIVSPAAE